MAAATPAVSPLPIIGFPPPHHLCRRPQQSVQAVGGLAIKGHLGGSGCRKMILHCESEGVWPEKLQRLQVSPKLCGGRVSGMSGEARSAGFSRGDEVPHTILSAKQAQYCFSRVVIPSLMNLRATVIDSESSYQFSPVQTRVQAVPELQCGHTQCTSLSDSV